MSIIMFYFLAGTITELEDHLTAAEASMLHLLNQ